MILSRNCELIRKNKFEFKSNDNNTQEEGANLNNRFYSIKYNLDGDIVENGPFSAEIVTTFLQNYYFNKNKEEQKKMNLLIRDILDDSCFPPETFYNSLQKRFDNN